ncbi:MAG: hypothetical protein KC502_02900 [Myxococcales bacterium]|nr:hypothetical protein [Myxococcales bacterium]
MQTSPPPPSSASARPTWLARLGAWLLLGCVVASALWFVVQRYQRGAASPQTAHLEAAVAIVDAELRKDDAIAFLPSWTAAQRWRFEALWKKRDLDFVRAWMPGDPIDPWDADGFARLWVLTTHNHHADLTHVGRQLRAEQLGGGMRLLLFALAPSATRFDFQAQLGKADVRRIGPKPGVQERCRHVGDSQKCKGDWWTSISAAMHEVGNTRRRCLFVQPHPAGATLRLRWPIVPGGDAIVGRVGNQLWAVRYDEGSDVRFSVRVGGKIVHTQLIARGDFRWHRWRVPLGPDDQEKSVALEFAAADPTWRQLCVDARVVGKAAGPEFMPSTATETNAP